MNSAIAIRMTTAILLCMFWGLATRAAETALPTEPAAASSASPRTILEPTQAASWAYRNGIALSIAAAGTARQDNAAPQAAPSPQGAPARRAARAPAKAGKRWTALRIGVVAVGLGLTGTGAYMTATGPMVPLPGGTGAGCSVPGHCVGSTVWSGKKKAGVWMMGFGVPLSLAGLFAQ